MGDLQHHHRAVDQHDLLAPVELVSLVEATNASVIRTYEARIAGLEQRKPAVAETPANLAAATRSFEELFELAIDFPRILSKLWDSGRLTERRVVLRLGFADKSPYVRNESDRTAETILVFKALASILAGGGAW